MYHHVKKLMYTVNIGEPDVRFGNMMLEQFGGANGELAAAMQYTIQGWNCVDDLGRRDLLMDIGTEELSHLEVVGALIRMHLKPLKTNREAAEADPLVTIAGGGGVALFDSMGNAWTSTYLKVTGELDVDLRSNIAAEARAKIVYERLIERRKVISDKFVEYVTEVDGKRVPSRHLRADIDPVSAVEEYIEWLDTQ